MKIIKNKVIPFKGFTSINLFGVLFVREEEINKITPEVLNHECIHTEQMKELLYILFYLIYLIEWIVKLFTNRFSSMKAYENISFEKEAYSYMNDLKYLDNRKHFAMWRK